MFRAIWRYVKSIGYLLTGQIDAARKTLDTNPHVVRATYDEVIRDKKRRINQYRQAVASLVAQEEKKIQQISRLTEDVQRLERLKTGAAAKAKQRITALQAQGKTAAEVQSDEEYRKCQAAYRDFSSTLAEKQDRIEELERDVQSGSTRIADHKVQLQSLLREVEKVKTEAADTVADMITAKEEKELADLVTGLSTDGANAELQRMRDLRSEVRAEARVAKEMAGTDTRAQEAEFLEFARHSGFDDEFDKLVGLAEEKDRAAAPAETEPPERSSDLPE